MPTVSERRRALHTLEKIIEWEILTEDTNNGSSSSSSSDEEDDSSNSDSNGEVVSCDGNISKLVELYFLMDNTRYMNDRHRFAKSQDFFNNFFENLPVKSFRQLTRMDHNSFFSLVQMIESHPIFANESSLSQAPMALQLVVTLDRLGHDGNGSCIAHLVPSWGASHGSMVNYSDRCITAMRSALKDQVKWPDQRERLRISSEFAKLGFRGCIGLIDGSLFPLTQRPRKDGECYWDRKCRYSVNGQVVCDDRRRIILFYTGNPGSCSNLTCLRRCPVWPQFEEGDLFYDGQYLLGDSGYVALPHLVASYRQSVKGKDSQDFNFCVAKTRYLNEHCIGVLKSRWHWLKEIRTQLKQVKDSRRMVKWMEVCVMLHNYVLNRNDDWTDEDQRIEIETDSSTGVAADDLEALYTTTCQDLLMRGRSLQQIVKERALAFNRRAGGFLWGAEIGL